MVPASKNVSIHLVTVTTSIYVNAPGFALKKSSKESLSLYPKQTCSLLQSAFDEAFT